MAPSRSLWSIPAGKATIAAFVVTVFYILWIFSGGRPSGMEPWISALAQNASLVLFVYFGLQMLRRNEMDPRLRRSWLLFIAAIGALVLAEAIHILQGRPEHSIAELFYIAYYGLYILGILLLPFIPLTRNEKVLFLLDLIIVTLASFLLLWHFSFDSIWTMLQAKDYSGLARNIYPVLDLFIVACAVAMIQRDVEGVHPGGLVLIAIANAYISIADALWAMGAFQASTVGANAISAIYTSGRAFLLLGLALQIQWLAFPTATSRYHRYRNLLSTVPPYLAGFVVFLLLAVTVIRDPEVPRMNLIGVALGTPVLALLIFYRQYMILQENMLLYKGAKEAREEAERATRAKGEFLANVSHEIRTPMHGVIGMSEMLIGSGLNESQLQMAETLKRSGQHLLRVINDVLDFSKLDSAKLEVESKPFELHRCIHAALDAFRFEAEKQGLQLSCTIDSTVPEVLVGDGTRFAQVLLNLLSNALKFTSRGEIRVICAGRRLSTGKAEIQVDVIDTGTGIPAHLQDKLFQSFSQIDGSSSRRHGGTGLGLAISKRLCEMMGGTMWVQSEEGLGATFSFTIIGDAGEASIAREQETEYDRSLGKRCPMRILIVDDNPVNQRVTGMMVKQLGYEADFATDGNEAIERSVTHGYDLILMDIQMPGMDGLECTRRIRQSSSAADPIIIAMTASSILGDREKFLSAGMNDVITKPARMKDLEAKLQHWWKNGSARRMEQLQIPIMASLTQEERKEFLTDLIRTFLQDGVARLQSMREALSDRRIAALKAEAHSLKGASAMLGLQALEKCCAEIENLCGNSDDGITHIEELVTRVALEFELASKTLSTYLG